MAICVNTIEPIQFVEICLCGLYSKPLVNTPEFAME